MKMELWVRSQYKEMLFKVNNNLIIRHNDNVENGMYFIECDSCKIAMYKTRERALKVLDEIEERIMLINTINIAKDTNSLIACKNALSEEKIKGLNYPYKMPEK